MPLNQSTESPRYLRLHEADNVAVIVNDGGVSADTAFGDGLRVRDSIPQSHKVALRGIAEGEAVLHYGQVIGAARRAIPEGGWVQESDLVMPTPPALDSLPRCTDVPPDAPPLEGYTFDRYLGRGHSDRSANTSPGNKAGGLSNILEKALGATAKSGRSAISGVIGPGERAQRKGLLFCAPPAGDFVCGTLQLAAGMNLHVFTTGRGTPYGLAMAPVIKVSSRTELAQRWPDLIDVDAGRIAAARAPSRRSTGSCSTTTSTSPAGGRRPGPKHTGFTTTWRSSIRRRSPESRSTAQHHV